MELSVEIGSGFSKWRVKNEGIVLHLDFEGVGCHELSVPLAFLRGRELLDPHLDSFLQSFNQDVRDSLVKLIDPDRKVREALDFKDINNFLCLFDLVG